MVRPTPSAAHPTVPHAWLLASSARYMTLETITGSSDDSLVYLPLATARPAADRGGLDQLHHVWATIEGLRLSIDQSPPTVATRRSRSIRMNLGLST